MFKRETNLGLEGISDSDYLGDLNDFKSTTGVTIFIVQLGNLLENG